MFERFTEQGRRVVSLARDQAQELRHEYVGTEHILLGLLCDQEFLAARVLGSLGVTLERARAEVTRIVGAGEATTTATVPAPFTPRAKKVLELSLRESLSLGHSYVGSEHILLGLARENDGIGSRILLACGADAEKIRMKVVEALSSSPRAMQTGGVTTPGQASGSEPWFSVGPAASLRRLLMNAAARALDGGRSEIAPSDVLLALTRDAELGPVLASLGVDEATARDAIRRAGASEEPPEAGAGG